MKWNYFERRWDCPRCGNFQKTNESENKKLDEYINILKTK